jgi:hypothetical protein
MYKSWNKSIRQFYSKFSADYAFVVYNVLQWLQIHQDDRCSIKIDLIFRYQPFKTHQNQNVNAHECRYDDQLLDYFAPDITKLLLWYYKISGRA